MKSGYTEESALSELGLSAGASADEIRRAYLRTIKQRNPEVDPAGFQRAREAYERLRETTTSHVTESSTVASPSSNVGLAREEVRDAEAYVARGNQRSASKELRALLASRRWAEARASIVDAYERAAAALASPTIPPRTVVLAILQLHANARHTTALGLTTLLAEWCARRGGDLAAFGERHLPWLAAQELSGLGKRIPSRTRAALAAALLDGRNAQRLAASLRELDLPSARALRASPALCAHFALGSLDADPTVAAAKTRGKMNSWWVTGIFAAPIFVLAAGHALSRCATTKSAPPEDFDLRRSLGELENALHSNDCVSARGALARARAAPAGSATGEDLARLAAAQEDLAAQCEVQDR